MACAVPVVASHASALPEITGQAAILVNPVDTDSIAQALLRVCKDNDLRQKLREEGIRRAEHFTYRKFAERLMEFYQQMDSGLNRKKI